MVPGFMRQLKGLKMKSLALTILQQEALLQAHLALDGHEIVSADKVVRVPYKLGAERRAAIKNINVLRKNLLAWDEVRKAIVKEYWANKPDYEEADKNADPETWHNFMAQVSVAATRPDVVELEPFSAAVMYDSHEFPLGVIAALDEHGLIEG